MNNYSGTSMGGSYSTTTDGSFTYVWDNTSEPPTWTNITWSPSIVTKPFTKRRLAYIMATCKQDEEPCVLAIYPEKNSFALLIHLLFSNSDTTWIFNTPEAVYHFIEEQAGLGKFTELKFLIGPEELKNRMVLDKARSQKEE